MSSSDQREPTPRQIRPRDRWLSAGICAALAALVWLVFGQAAGFDFVNYDDAANVSGNPQVAAGLSGEGTWWAFTHSQVGRWTPLTTLSHMADCQFFGMEPGRHHLTSIFLQAAIAVLLFLALRELTGALWRSAFAAALFAIHPLRAEAVAWVSERGDLIAGLFFMLALLAYARHARSGGVRSAWLWATAAFFALGLMGKPSIIAFPIVLLVLDFWPLGRVTKFKKENTRLLVKKIPLFALAILAIVAAALAESPADIPFENPPALRIGNALVSCVIYLRQTLWPANLAVFYPMPGTNGTAPLPAWQPIAAFLFLAIASAGAWIARRRFPWVSAGWLWYLAMLAPVLGLIETGEQSHADRYTYFAQIGLCIIAAWGAEALTARLPARLEIRAIGACLLLLLLALRASGQAATWSDSFTLWNHALETTGPNVVAENNLGIVLLHQGRIDAAMERFTAAIALDPGRAEAHLDMGNALLKSARPDDAIAEYYHALKISPRSTSAHMNLGVAFAQEQRYDEAVAEYLAAIGIDPAIPDAHANLAGIYRRMGRLEDAIAEYRQALALDPSRTAARAGLAAALREQAHGN